MWSKIVVYMVENCRIYGGKLSYIWWKIVAYTDCIVYSARINARITIVTLRQRFHFSAIVLAPRSSLDTRVASR